MPWLSRVNPFAKLVGAALLSSSGWFAGNSLLAVSITMAIILALVVTAKIPRVFGFIKLMGVVGALVTISWTINFATRGVPVSQALREALFLALRLLTTTGSFFVAVETTSAGALAAACCKFGVPARATLFIVLIVGAIPLLREEFRLIGETQRARGLELDRGPIWKRALYALARGVPLMVQAYRMAEAISLGLSLHGFDPATRRTTWRNVGWFKVECDFPLTTAGK